MAVANRPSRMGPKLTALDPNNRSTKEAEAGSSLGIENISAPSPQARPPITEEKEQPDSPVSEDQGKGQEYDREEAEMARRNRSLMSRTLDSFLSVLNVVTGLGSDERAQVRRGKANEVAPEGGNSGGGVDEGVVDVSMTPSHARQNRNSASVTPFHEALAGAGDAGMPPMGGGGGGGGGGSGKYSGDATQELGMDLRGARALRIAKP